MQYFLFNELTDKGNISIYTNRITWVKKRDLVKKLYNKLKTSINLLFLFLALTSYILLLGIIKSIFICFILVGILIIAIIINVLYILIIKLRYDKVKDWKKKYQKTKEYLSQINR